MRLQVAALMRAPRCIVEHPLAEGRATADNRSD